MKKTLAVVVAILVALTVFASAAKEQVVILNNALGKLESSYQNYNAFGWYSSYSMADIVKDNLWHQPTDATVTITGSAEPSIPGVDVMLWGADPSQPSYRSLFGFKDRYVAFQYMVPTEDYDVYLGKGVEKKGQDIQYMNYSIVGDEAILYFMWEVNVSDLLGAMKDNAGKSVVPATMWQVVDVDGNKTLIKDAEFKAAQFVSDGQTVDLAVGKQTIKNVQSIAPADATKNTACADDEIIRFVVALNAKGVYGEEAKYVENRAGYYYPRPYEAMATDPKMPGCYALADLFEKYGVEEGTDFFVECWYEPFGRDEAWDLISKKYITYDNKSGHELITLGQVQAKTDDSVWNIGYLTSDKAVFAYIPEIGIKLADAFSRLVIDEPVKKVVVTYTNGVREFFTYEAAQELVLEPTSNILKVALY